MNRLNAVIDANIRIAQAMWNSDRAVSRYYLARVYDYACITKAIRRCRQ